MALIKCPDCGKEFSEYAECCPECGCPVEVIKKRNVETIQPQLETEQSMNGNPKIINDPPKLQYIQQNKSIGLVIVVVILSLVVIGLLIGFLVIKCSQDSINETTHTECPDGNHPHMIDLGLPSGTIWACCNVGAHKPEEYGSYFAWGETEEKSVYNVETYKWYNNTGYVDIGSDIAGTSYDAATANWDTPWQMPSLEQCQELIDKCNSVETIQNGVWGRKFTGPNGGAIFLPAAGLRCGSGVYVAGSDGYYWSSSLYESSKDGAYYFCIRENVYWDDYDRGNGLSVRPVRPVLKN